jgi:hypothetical protein
MATVTRVNGLKAVVGTIFNPNCNLYIIAVKNAAAAAINLQDEDDAVDEVVEMIVKEINPLAYFTPVAADGIIYVVMDKGINDPVDLRTRIRNLGNVNTVDITGTTVAVPSSFTLA